MTGKSFYVKAVARHNKLKVGDVVYIKPIEFKFSVPTLYAILDGENGERVGSIDANQLRNRFEVTTKHQH